VYLSLLSILSKPEMIVKASRAGTLFDLLEERRTRVRDMDQFQGWWLVEARIDLQRSK
jgi:hypothetical protein